MTHSHQITMQAEEISISIEGKKRSFQSKPPANIPLETTFNIFNSQNIHDCIIDEACMYDPNTQRSSQSFCLKIDHFRPEMSG